MIRIAAISLLLLVAFLATRRREARQLNWPDRIPEGIWIAPDDDGWGIVV